MAKIAILLVDDHEVVRQGLRALLATEEDMVVVGEARDGLEALRVARETSPDVVVMDLSMPGSNGLDATRRILQQVPTAKVLVLSSYDDPECVTQLIQAGATGYLTKRSAANEMVEAIRTVRRGKAFYSAEVAQRLRRQAAASKGSGSVKSGLTEREAQVLQLIAEGFPNKGIAAELGISVKTVEKHRQAVMNKLNIHEVAGLTRYAIATGAVPQKLPARE